MEKGVGVCIREKGVREGERERGREAERRETHPTLNFLPF